LKIGSATLSSPALRGLFHHRKFAKRMHVDF
jgi:hypothetical protein